MPERLIQEIASAWSAAKTVVAFTGAGMSTESGLPDFRSAQGLWKQRPEFLATMTAMRQMPDEFYFFYQWRIQRLWSVKPNPGHLALAELEEAGLVQHVITQNVDGLHHRAGSLNVSELHGTLKSVSCLNCQTHYDSRQILPQRGDWEAEYQNGGYRHGAECACPRCGGNLRPDVVLFGESLPEDAWDVSQQWSRKADLFVVIGSSLAVSPANYLPQIAVEAGAKLLIINQESTPLDHFATWCLRTKAAATLPSIAARVREAV
jgi:NAD-dependent deacetylase